MIVVTYWQLTIILKNLPRVKRNLFAADLKFFEADLKASLWDELFKLKNDRNLLAKMAKKMQLTKVTKEFLGNSLEALLNLDTDLITTEYMEHNSDSIGTVKFHEKYFEVWNNIKSSNPLFNALANPLTTKRGIMQRMEKEVIKAYKPESYEISEKDKVE